MFEQPVTVFVQKLEVRIALRREVAVKGSLSAMYATFVLVAWKQNLAVILFRM